MTERGGKRKRSRDRQSDRQIDIYTTGLMACEAKGTEIKDKTLTVVYEFLKIRM